MAWFKVDDKLHDHRKARIAGTRALGLWVLAGSWCADNLTDGFIPDTVATRWGNRRDIKALTDAGLWTPTKRGEEAGYLFHDWMHFQPTRDELTSRISGRRSGGILGAHRRWHRDKPAADCPFCEGQRYG